MNQHSYFAYSKINLGLQVLNLREDGYHNINTVFYLINLYDKIDFSLNDKIEIHTSPDSGIVLEENLIYKAAKLFFETTGVEGGVRVDLTKNIPIGAGLGGGSSDAVTTIIALNRLYKTGCTHNTMRDIANKIGSDCAFFLCGSKTAAGSGRGEILSWLQKRLDCSVAIVNPGIHISTPLAYKKLGRTAEKIEQISFSHIIANDKISISDYKDKIFNDFESVVFDMHPEIAKIKEELYKIGADFALMSGSGSTVFGLFTKAIELDELQAHFPKYFCHIT